VVYLLDTNTCIFAMKWHDRVVERLRSSSPDDLSVSAVTVAELWFGARKSRRPERTRQKIDRWLAPLRVLPFDLDAAGAYSEIRSALESAGTPIGERDTMIASVALARGLVVVTNNTREFGRIGGLLVEDWST
jgi:tRNA(fMet)-specific endonuclease VapC